MLLGTSESNEIALYRHEEESEQPENDHADYALGAIEHIEKAIKQLASCGSYFKSEIGEALFLVHRLSESVPEEILQAYRAEQKEAVRKQWADMRARWKFEREHGRPFDGVAAKLGVNLEGNVS